MTANKQYPVDVSVAREAVELLDKIEVGQCIEGKIMNLPTSAQWELVGKSLDEPETWLLRGSFCGIPFYTLTVILVDGKKMSLEFQEIS